MAESNDKPPLCPCGFWGSAQTSGLCSVCYKRQQQQSRELDATSTLFVPVSSSSTAAGPGCPAVTVTATATVSDSAKSSAPVPTNASLTDETSREAAAVDSDSSAAACSGSRDGSPSRPVQKNKKRCFSCKARLELAFVEIGRCKCGYTFCELHRLPEQHACTYDHKESGRQEAREKMISPKKHVGTTLRRLDSDT